jgi:mono/diheme cytochrome c family protein
MTLKDGSRISKRLAKTIAKFLKFLSREKIKNPETVFKNKTTNIDPSLLSTIRLSKNRIDINDGKILYDNYCSTCHGESGEGGEGLRLNNPEMIDIYLRNEAHFYKNTIKMGRKGTLMKGWRYEFLGTLNENQINSIIEFIKQQWFTIPTGKTEPSEYDIKTLNISSTIESGKKIYDTLCYSCHNPMISTSNAPDLRNYSFVGTDRDGNPFTIDNEQLRYIIKNGRDNTLMKPFSMKENGIFELSDKDIDSIILYIRRRPVVYK